MEEKKSIFESKTIIVKILMVALSVSYRPIYEAIMHVPEAYFLFDVLVTIGMRLVTNKGVKL